MDREFLNLIEIRRVFYGGFFKLKSKVFGLVMCSFSGFTNHSNQWMDIMMKTMIPHKILLALLVTFQIVGPSWALALQSSDVSEQAAAGNQALLAGIGGVVTVIPEDNTRPGFTPKYRSALSIGDVITTEEESVAELLLEDNGLIAIQEYSEAALGQEDNGSLSVVLQVGIAEWSLPTQNSGSEPSIFNTPNVRATTQGGLVSIAVQQTLAKTARASEQPNPFLIRTSLYAKATGLLETFCVHEGNLTLESKLGQTKIAKAGECLGFLDGQLRTLGNEFRPDGRPAFMCFVDQHCEIPDSAKKMIAKKQMGQALALESALVGSDAEDPQVDEQIVLATTGFFEGLGGGPGGAGVGDVILPTTGDDGTGGGGTGGDGGTGGGGTGGGGTGGGGNPPPPSIVDVISPTTDSVDFVNNVVFIDRQDTTEATFLPFTGVLGYNDIDGLGTVVAVTGTPGNPSNKQFEDRVIGILDGTTLQPRDGSVTAGLISVQDSTLIGPATAPLIEVIDSTVETNFAVTVGATVFPGNNDPLDQALIEASSPLLAMIRGDFTANTEFGLVAGQNAELRADMAGDALVQLDASSMVVNGNLFRVTNGGVMNVMNASLVSLSNGSTFSLNGGAFVSVEAGGTFTLTNGALVNFGAGTNTVNVTNTLCASGCFTPFPHLPDIQVAGNPANFSAPSGYQPFVNAGGSNTVNITPGSAILNVQGGGQITIQN